MPIERLLLVHAAAFACVALSLGVGSALWNVGRWLFHGGYPPQFPQSDSGPSGSSVRMNKPSASHTRPCSR